MNIIKGVLAEELANSERLLKKYQLALKELPKGSVVEKKIKGYCFHYLAYRDGQKVRFSYQGRLSDKELGKYKEVKGLRAKYRGLISDLRKQIIFIKRALHERKRRTLRALPRSSQAA